jgi:hypothetical protein
MEFTSIFFLARDQAMSGLFYSTRLGENFKNNLRFPNKMSGIITDKRSKVNGLNTRFILLSERN